MYNCFFVSAGLEEVNNHTEGQCGEYRNPEEFDTQIIKDIQRPICQYACGCKLRLTLIRAWSLVGEDHASAKPWHSPWQNCAAATLVNK